MSAGTRSDLRLVGDIGGTNARFALAEIAGDALRLVEPRGFLCADFPTLEAAIETYLAQAAPGRRPDTAVVAVAGPVTDGEAALTNGLWRMSDAALLAQGFEAARLINDYAAQALSLRRLEPADLGAIGEGRADHARSAAIIGAGTGLGVGAVIRDGDGEAVAVTEGGHIAFAPSDALEIEILARLAERFGRVSLERILSGPGLVNLHWALAGIRKVEIAPLEPRDVVERALSGSDALCLETLHRFCAIYGAAAGDFALAFGAVGGVYLGGGIAPRIVDFLRAGAFRERFEAKGRFGAYTGPIATSVILHPHAALLGAADFRMTISPVKTAG